MKRLHRPLVVILLALPLLAGCGNDKKDNATNDTVNTPTTAAAVNGPVTTPAGVTQGVTDGQPCSPQGARGVTKDGINELCALVGGENRWRPA